MIRPEEFDAAVKANPRSREPFVMEFLDHALALLSGHVEVWEEGIPLFRAQVGGDLVADCYLDDQERPGIRAFDSGRMIPVRSEDGGRFHFKDESSFYFSAEMETAIKEMKPGRGTELSVALFKTLRRLKLVIIREWQWAIKDQLKEARGGVLSSEQFDQKFMASLYRWCSSPLSCGCEADEYALTQRLAEHFRENEFDGIVYESAADEGKYVGALFCPQHADPQQYFPTIVAFQQCVMHRVARLDVVLDLEYEKNPFVLPSDKQCLLAKDMMGAGSVLES